VSVLLIAAGLSWADGNGSLKANEVNSMWRQETLTNGLLGLGNVTAEKGIEVSLSATQIYQQNTRGGISTHRRAGTGLLTTLLSWGHAY
jgi:hypothetical protein